MMWMQLKPAGACEPDRDVYSRIHNIGIYEPKSAAALQVQEFSSSAQLLYSFPIQLLDEKETTERCT